MKTYAVPYLHFARSEREIPPPSIKVIQAFSPEEAQEKCKEKIKEDEISFMDEEEKEMEMEDFEELCIPPIFINEVDDLDIDEGFLIGKPKEFEIY